MNLRGERAIFWIDLFCKLFEFLSRDIGLPSKFIICIDCILLMFYKMIIQFFLQLFLLLNQTLMSLLILNSIIKVNPLDLRTHHLFQLLKISSRCAFIFHLILHQLHLCLVYFLVNFNSHDFKVFFHFFDIWALYTKFDKFGLNVFEDLFGIFAFRLHVLSCLWARR